MSINTFKDKSNRIERRSLFNLITGFSYQIMSIGMGLLLPYLFITSLGSESNGLLNSIGQVFTCLSLLEAGVGTTTIQALYRPIAENDKKEINAILSATNSYYRRTGYWYIVSIAILVVAYPFLVDSNLSAITIRLVILLQGAGAVISYLYQAKYSLLLRAEGKNYVITMLSLILLVTRNSGKIIAILLGFNIVTVQIIQFITVLIEATVIVAYVKRKYPWLSVRVIPDYGAISQKNSVLTQSIAWMIFNHTDILVLTVFTKDLRLVSVYSVYSLLFEAAQNVLNQIRESFQYKIGRIAQKGNSLLDQYFKHYSTIILMLTLTLFSTIYLFSISFIPLYTKDVTDTNYQLSWVPELFLIYKVLYGIRALDKQLIEANGHFKQTQHIALIEAASNIVLSVILVIPYKVQGVLLGSALSVVISVYMYLLYLQKNVARKAVFSQLMLIMVSLPLFCGVFIIGSMKLLYFKSWLELLIATALIGCICLLLYYICLRVSRLFNRGI